MGRAAPAVPSCARASARTTSRTPAWTASASSTPVAVAQVRRRDPLVRADLDHVDAALLAVLVNRAGFERAGVEGPAVDLETLVRVAERDVIDEPLQLLHPRERERRDVRPAQLPLHVRVEHQDVEQPLAARAPERVAEQRDGGVGRSPEPVSAEDARAADVDVGARAPVLVPRDELEAVGGLRLEEREEAPRRERAHPTVLGDGVALIVVALDGDDRDAGLLQPPQPDHGVVHRLGIDLARVEKVAADEDEIDAARDGVVLDHVDPRAREVFRALVEVVAAAAEVDVRDVQEFHNSFGGRGRASSSAGPDGSGRVSSVKLLYDKKRLEVRGQGPERHVFRWLLTSDL
jgi:hypothetical protein